MLIPEFNFDAEAENDLISIWDYTLNTWGEEQANKYFSLLRQCAEAISTGVASTKQVHEISDDLWVHHCQHHMIFFHKNSTITIVAVLHERMNLIERLHKRLTT